jgi:flagellar hook-associated protein 2
LIIDLRYKVLKFFSIKNFKRGEIMTTTTTTTSATSLTSLDSTYQNLIDYTLQVEGAPLTKLETQQTELTAQRAIYNELKTKLDALRSASKALVSTDPFYTLKAGRTVSVSNIATGTTVISAASSSYAVASSYDISDISLALADRVRSDQQEYSDQELGKSGTIYIGGAENRSQVADIKSTDTIANIGTSESIATGQKELGSGTYYVETRQSSSGAWQFRLVDSDGNAAKIANGKSTSSFTNAWQEIPTDGNAYSTGRGLEITFGTDSSKFVTASKSSGATSLVYQAKGSAIDINTSMSLNDIASAINKGSYADGNEVVATVVNKQLMLSSKYTGAAHKIQASGQVLQDLGVLSGSSFKNVMQSAKNATFKVNGLSVTRSQNSALTDVISGVTLNLASDAEGKSATLNIASDNTSQKTAINTFITNFNAVQTYINTNIALTKNSDGTYTRGSLSGDQSIVSLRSSLFNLITSSDSTATVYKSLSNIGITVDSNLTMAITDSTKLDNALNNNYSDVISTMDRVMKAVTTKLDKYTGTNSYVDQLINTNATKTINVGNSIVSLNKRLDAREQVLIKYYADIQSQMDVLNNTSSTNSAWITSLYSSLYSS